MNRAFLLAAICLVLAGGTAQAARPTVAVAQGGLTGQTLADGIIEFTAVPYAAPPVGENRFRPPEPPAPWRGPRQNAPCPACRQSQRRVVRQSEVGTASEDCLYLNIWTPTLAPKTPLPVMVWIHGGGFNMGSGGKEAYNGARLAARGAVVATINYRLGVFGFLAHPWLSAESPQGASGNYGLLDQVAALAWVRENIRAFGGDPARVTIFGESAGARSVSFLLVSPLAKGLFSRAIVQSGSLFRPMAALKTEQDGLPAMEAVGQKLAARLGVSSVEELRQLPPERIEKALRPASTPLISPPEGPQSQGAAVFSPIVDGYVFPDDPRLLLESGRVNPARVILGSNKSEATIFLKPYLDFAEENGFEALVKRFFPRQEKQVAALYPLGPEMSLAQAVNRFLTEAVWTFADRLTARALAAAGRPVHVYHLTHRLGGPLYRLGSYHGLDIRFVFGDLAHPAYEFTAEDQGLCRLMQAYWVNFAASGDPNAEGLPAWPAYTRPTEEVLDLNPEPRLATWPRPQALDVFTQIHEQRKKGGS